MKITRITYDSKADAAYIYTDNTNPVDHTAPLDHGIAADYDIEGKLIGLEVLWVRDQLANTCKLPSPRIPPHLMWTALHRDNYRPRSKNDCGPAFAMPVLSGVTIPSNASQSGLARRNEGR
jgi:uncharacterized protein YuzE